ncbi:MAG: exopolysaccharide biosynthesis protein exod [Rhizobiales bacterium 65-9]|nr:MAG: exopolysaccharide biosynthesis protein exod [Rhizobiales bacterium 65-9]
MTSASAGDRLTLRSMLDALGERAFALGMLLFALPSCIPMVPPIPLISGLLIAVLAAQMVAGWRTPWLPRRLLDWSVDRTEAARVLGRARPFIRRIEGMLSPRAVTLTVLPGLRLTALALLLFALALLVAAPFIGQIPLGVAIALVGIGITERDGVVVIVGLAIGAVGVAISAGFVAAVVAGAMAVF